MPDNSVTLGNEHRIMNVPSSSLFKEELIPIFIDTMDLSKKYGMTYDEILWQLKLCKVVHGDMKQTKITRY